MRTWIAVGGVACLIVSIVWVTLVHVARLHTWRAALCGTGLACLVGSAIGSAMVYVAMDHNPQDDGSDQLRRARGDIRVVVRSRQRGRECGFRARGMGGARLKIALPACDALSFSAVAAFAPVMRADRLGQRAH